MGGLWAKAKAQFERHRTKYLGLAISITILIWLLQGIIGLFSFQVSVGVTLNIIMFFVVIGLDYLVGLKRPGDVEVYEKEKAAAERIRQYIRDEGVDQVRLIEYSTGSIRESWLNYVDDIKGVKIRLLMRHPSTVTEHQRQDRICPSIRDLARRFGETSDLQIMCYSTPASLRGRNFDDKFLVVGWYTYYRDGTRLIDGQPEMRVRGHDNPMTAAFTSNKAGACLKEMFNWYFDNLWEYGMPLQDICGHHPWCSECRSRPTGEWLSKTNPRVTS